MGTKTRAAEAARGSYLALVVLFIYFLLKLDLVIYKNKCYCQIRKIRSNIEHYRINQHIVKHSVEYNSRDKKYHNTDHRFY